MSIPQVPSGCVVVGVDGSEGARRAVTWAARQAHREHRTLALVHGTDATTPQRGAVWLVLAGVDHSDLARALREGGESLLHAARAQAEAEAPGVTCVTAVVDDDARAALVELSHEAHLVVVGSRGLGPLRTPVLGSVSASVARRARCPVVVCRPVPRSPDTLAGAHPDAPVDDARVVVGCDSSGTSGSAVELAFRQASTWGVPLTVVHCFYDVAAALHGRGPALGGEEDLSDEHRLVAETVAGLGEKYPDVDVSTEVRRGLVDEVLTHELPPDALLVVGRSEGPRLSWHLSVALAVLERSHTTVVVVPEPVGGVER